MARMAGGWARSFPASERSMVPGTFSQASKASALGAAVVSWREGFSSSLWVSSRTLVASMRAAEMRAAPVSWAGAGAVSACRVRTAK